MRILLVVLAVLLLCGDVLAASYEAITVADTAIGVTSTVYKPTTGREAKECFFTVETAPIRVRWDGSNPSSTVGHLFNAGDSFVVSGYNNLITFRAIRTTSTSASLKVTCE